MPILKFYYMHNPYVYILYVKYGLHNHIRIYSKCMNCNILSAFRDMQIMTVANRISTKQSLVSKEVPNTEDNQDTLSLCS